MSTETPARRRWRKEHQAEINQRNRERHAADPSIRQAIELRYRQSHPEKLRLKEKARYEKDPVAAKRRAYNSVHKNAYGISLEQREVLLEKQGKKCAACGIDMSAFKSKRVQLDHCHITKRVRGIVCQGCNLAIGHAGENPERLEALATYLRQFA